jgi:O-antigen ligase
MQTSRHKSTTGFTGEYPAIALAAFVAVISAATLCGMGKYHEAAAGAAGALGLGFVIAFGISVESVLIAWFVTTPLASYFIRFPIDQSIITFDRAVIALALLLLVIQRKRATGEPLPVSRFEMLWGAVAVIATLSALVASTNYPYATRVAVDSFLLPLLIFHIARYHLDLRGREGQIVLGAMLLAILFFATGAYEFLTGNNLFEYRGSVLVREGEVRVNGPFAADTAFANISMLMALFLLAAPRALPLRFDKTGKLLYAIAFLLGAAAAILPLYRAVAIALLVCGLVIIISAARETGGRPRAVVKRLLPAPALVALFALIATLGQSINSERISDPRNVFGRLATWEAATRIALDNPLTGVGLANYTDFFRQKYRWEDESVETVMQARAADSPHSNLLWIAAELGLVTALLYIAANIFLFLIGWRALRRAQIASERAAAMGFLSLLVAYWITGITLASGYYSDLNLYLFFMLGLLSNRSLTLKHKSAR